MNNLNLKMKPLVAQQRQVVLVSKENLEMTAKTLFETAIKNGVSKQTINITSSRTVD